MSRSLAFLTAILVFSAAVASAQNPLAELRAAAGAAGANVIVTVPQGRPAGPVGRRRPGTGREEAAQYCSQAAFSSDRDACIRAVSAADYFDTTAIAVCRKVSFSGEVPKCAAAIADKAYLRAEIDLCGKESFGSGIISCFQNAGRPTRGGGGDAYTVRQLRRIARRLRDGYVREALFELEELIDTLDDGRP